jgi:hypothetical protein
MMTLLEKVQGELEELREAVGGLAYLASTPPVRRGVCAPLDTMRQEFAGRLHNGVETRPQPAAPEQRAKAVV